MSFKILILSDLELTESQRSSLLSIICEDIPVVLIYANEKVHTITDIVRIAREYDASHALCNIETDNVLISVSDLPCIHKRRIKIIYNILQLWIHDTMKIYKEKYHI